MGTKLKSTYRNTADNSRSKKGLFLYTYFLVFLNFAVYSESKPWHIVHIEHIVLTSYKSAPHNRYQPHPAEPEQYTKCSNRVFVLLKMGIMMPKIC